jgi:hypothetical protein
MNPVTANPTIAHSHKPRPVTAVPVVIGTGAENPNRKWISTAIATTDKIPVAASPLYSARMIPLSAPSRTKKVPITEVAMHTAPMPNGNKSILSRTGSVKKIAASSIVATIVTT